MKIEKFYVVLIPTKDSTIDDIFYDTDIKSLGYQFIGGLNPSQVAGVYTSEKEARAFAKDFLAKRDRLIKAISK